MRRETVFVRRLSADDAPAGPGHVQRCWRGQRQWQQQWQQRRRVSCQQGHRRLGRQHVGVVVRCGVGCVSCSATGAFVVGLGGSSRRRPPTVSELCLACCLPCAAVDTGSVAGLCLRSSQAAAAAAVVAVATTAPSAATQPPQRRTSKHKVPFSDDSLTVRPWCAGLTTISPILLRKSPQVRRCLLRTHLLCCRLSSRSLSLQVRSQRGRSARLEHEHAQRCCKNRPN